MSVNSEKSSSSERYGCISRMNAGSGAGLPHFPCQVCWYPSPIACWLLYRIHWLFLVKLCAFLQRFIDFSFLFFLNEACWAAACKSSYSRLLVCVCWCCKPCSFSLSRQQHLGFEFLKNSRFLLCCRKPFRGCKRVPFNLDA